jgi:hypothetical protein
MGNINDCFLCINANEYVDSKKDELNTKKNSESSKNKLNSWKKNIRIRNKCKKFEFLKTTEKILENIHLI